MSVIILYFSLWRETSCRTYTFIFTFCWLWFISSVTVLLLLTLCRNTEVKVQSLHQHLCVIINVFVLVQINLQRKTCLVYNNKDNYGALLTVLKWIITSTLICFSQTQEAASIFTLLGIRRILAPGPIKHLQSKYFKSVVQTQRGSIVLVHRSIWSTFDLWDTQSPAN